MTEGTPVNAHVFIKGEPKTLGPEVPRGFLQILGGAKVPAGRDRAADAWNWRNGSPIRKIR